MKHGFVLFFALLLQTTVAQDYADVVIETKQITDEFYVLFGAGGNIGLYVGEEESLLIDAQFAPLSERILEAVDRLTNHRPDYLLNTHWHGDHTGGNGNFADEGMRIYAHEQVYERLSTDQFMKAFSREVPARPSNFWPRVTFGESMTLHIDGETILFFHHHDGHTDGDGLVLFVENNVIHMGDVFFEGKYPFVDLGSGGSVEGLVKTLDQVLFTINEETHIVPGHGKVVKKPELQAYRDMIADCHEIIGAMIEEGLDYESILTKDPLKKYNEQWGQGFIKPDRWVNTIYTDLTRE